MRAIVMSRTGGPEVLAIGEIPRPEPKPNELLVRVAAAGVNRADLLQRRGQYPPPPGAPETLGLEFAGTVEAAPAGSEWHPGDRVMGLVGGGAYAEWLTVAADEVLPVPEGWSWAEAAAVPEAYLTAYDALVLQAHLAPGEHLLVHAVGSGVGIAALGVGKAVGAVVAGTSRTASKLERAKTLGLDRAVLAVNGFNGKELADWADVICELVAGPYLAQDLVAAAPRGRIVLIGLTAGREATLNLGLMLNKRIALIGTVLRTRPSLEKAVLVKSFRGGALPWLERGIITPVVDRVVPMADARKAHEHLEANANFGSVVLTW